MTIEEIQNKLDDLGIFYISDVASKQTYEDVIKIVEDLDKDPRILAAPLHIDGMTNRKYFNTREKILAYFVEKKVDSIDIMIEILREAMGIDKLDYENTKPNNSILNDAIKMYLKYEWVGKNLKEI